MQLPASKQYAVVAALVGVVAILSASLCTFGIFLWSKDVELMMDSAWRALPCDIVGARIKTIRQESCMFPGAIPCVNYKMDDACFLGLRGRGLARHPEATAQDSRCCNCKKDVFFLEWNLSYAVGPSQRESSVVYMCDDFLIVNELGVGSWTTDERGLVCNPAIAGSLPANVTCDDCHMDGGILRRTIEMPVSVSNTRSALNQTLRQFNDGSVVCYRNAAERAVRFGLHRGETLQGGTYFGQLLPVSCVFLGLAVMVFVFGMKGIYFAFRVW